MSAAMSEKFLALREDEWGGERKLPTFSWTLSKSLLSWATFEVSPPVISMKASLLSRSVSFLFLPLIFLISFPIPLSSSSDWLNPSSSLKPLAPPPWATAAKSVPIALVSPESFNASSLLCGTNPCFQCETEKREKERKA